MKKFIRVIALFIIVSLLGCGCANSSSNTEKQPNKNTSKTEEKEYQGKLDAIEPSAYGNVDGLKLEPGSYISIIGRFSGDSYWKQVEAGAKQAVADINAMLGYKGEDKIKLTFSAPDHRDNVDEQISILDEELARYPIAIGIAAIDATACHVQFELAADNGIPIVTMDSGSNYPDIAAHVSTDNLDSGVTVAHELAKLIDNSGEVAIFVQDSLSTTANEREKGFTDTITENYPDITISNVYHMDELTDVAKQIAEEKNSMLNDDDKQVDPSTISQKEVVEYIIESNSNLKAIFATNLDTTQMVASVLKSMKKTDLHFIGYDGGDKQMKLLNNDVLDGLVIQNPFGIGYATVVAAARNVLEMGNEAFVNCGYIWITKDNIEEKSIKKMLY